MLSTCLTVALAQMDVALSDPTANLAAAKSLITQAAAAGAELLVLPELWTTGYELARAGEFAATLDEPPFTTLSSLAREHRLHLVGSMLERQNSQIYNTAVWYDAAGALLGAYRKLHLFPLIKEHVYLTPGHETPLITSPWGPAAMALCYDLRFPELFRKYAVAGAKLMIIPAEWPYPRVTHWQILLRARAIENECFVIACNRVGQDRHNPYCGRSAVVDPGGQVLMEGKETPELLFAQLDLSLVEKVRSHIPVFANRRPECY